VPTGAGAPAAETGLLPQALPGLDSETRAMSAHRGMLCAACGLDALRADGSAGAAVRVASSERDERRERRGIERKGVGDRSLGKRTRRLRARRSERESREQRSGVWQG
jgi:hypothetical protein